MFSTIIATDTYSASEPEIARSLGLANSLDFEEALAVADSLINGALERSLMSHGEDALNELFVLAAYFKMLRAYVYTWRSIEHGKFADSWCRIQDTLDLLRMLKRLIDGEPDRLMTLIEEQFTALEGLYPYELFMSIGAVTERIECSICGEDIDGLECIHMRGELYGGEMAHGIIREFSRLDHIGIVKNPADKRCVIIFEDDAEQFSLVRFLSEGLGSGKLRPLDFEGLRHRTIQVQNPAHAGLGRNDACYCGSGRKFKHCCIRKQWLEREHIDVRILERDADDVM